jgi:tRNA (guanosine-2'-O-)-methyltransferase
MTGDVRDVLSGFDPLPAGPPLHFEEPGAVRRQLGPLVTPERLGRLSEVAARRTWRIAALLEDLTDPHNLAACARTADAMGVQHLHLVTPEGKPRNLSREVSLGSDRWVTVHSHSSSEAAVLALRAAGYLVAATDLGDSPPGPAAPPSPILALDDLELSRPLVLAFGNEHAGISPILRRLAEVRVRIPMHGFVDSLNVSVAFGVACHALRRKLGPAGDLDPVSQVRLVDRWLVSDLPRAREVLEFLTAREVAAGRPKG